jgi:hypothetical protein
MEANNGYEYRVLKVRRLSLSPRRAAERAVARASAEGWEVVSRALLDGVVAVPVVTLRRELVR